MSKIKEIAKKSKLLTKIYQTISNNKFTPVEKTIKKYYSRNSTNNRIILVGHSGGKGGAETLLKNMIKELRNQNIEVAVIVRGNGPIISEYKEIAPTFISNTEEKNKYYVEKLNELGYKSAIFNTVTTGDLIPLFHQYNIFVINLVHELPGVINTLKCEDRAKLIATESDLVVFPSKYVLDKYETICKVKTKKIIQPQGLYNVYDKFNTKESKKYIKCKYNIPNNHYIILNVGMGEKRKGFDLFLDVSKKLQKEKYSFIWVGVLDDEMKKLYQAEINQMSNIILPGFINDKEEFMKFYDACDIFLLTSREDPFPSVVLEAFNAERPVIAFENAGGFQDVVIDGKSGYLVKLEDTDEIVKKIRELVKDDKQRIKLGKGAKKISKEHQFPMYIKTLIEECKRGVKNG